MTFCRDATTLSFGLFLALATALRAHPPITRSLDEIERQLQLEPLDGAAWERRGELLLLSGRLEEAEEALLRARALERGARPSLLLAELQLRAARPEQADSTASLLLAGNLPPAQRATTLLLRARARRGLARLGEALVDLEGALDSASRPAPQLYIERDELLLAGAGAAARRSPTSLAERRLRGIVEGIGRLGNVPALVLRAIDLERQLGRIDAALDRLDGLALDAERRDEWWLRRAEILLAAGRADEAGRAAAAAEGELAARSAFARRSRAGALRAAHLQAVRQAVGEASRHDTLERPRRRRGATTVQPPAESPVLGPLVVPSLRRGPYLQRSSADGVVVRWRTDLASDSRLAWGPSPASLASQQVDWAATTEHVVLLGGLEPAQCYFYSVGTSQTVLAGAEASYRFCTAPPSAQAIRVWAIGDSGTANPDAEEVRDAYLQAYAGDPIPDVWLMLGDNAYNTGSDADYQAAVFEIYPSLLRQTSVWPTLGNHDALSASSATQSGPYFDIFSLPTGGEAGGLASGTEAYYSFDHGEVHFVCLDSAGFVEPGQAMLDWLAADLASTGRRWTIAFFHHPPYTKGSHDSDAPSDSGGRMFAVRQQLLPVLEAYGVDLVLAGHSHSYERSYLLDGHYGTSDTLQPEMILDLSSGAPQDATPYQKRHGASQGAVYVVAGSSGTANKGNGTLSHPVMHLSLERLGSLVLDIDDAAIEGRFLDETGAVLDHFRLDKDPGSIFLDGFETGAVDRWSQAELPP